MNITHLACTALLVTIAPVVSVQAGPQSLGDVSPYDRWRRDQSVLSVVIAPQQLRTPYFSPESLKRSLPDLYPAHIRADWCDGQEEQEEQEEQRGVVVFTNGDVVFWHSCAPGLISFEGDQYPGSYSFKNE